MAGTIIQNGLTVLQRMLGCETIACNLLSLQDLITILKTVPTCGVTEKKVMIFRKVCRLSEVNSR